MLHSTLTALTFQRMFRSMITVLPFYGQKLLAVLFFHNGTAGGDHSISGSSHQPPSSPTPDVGVSEEASSLGIKLLAKGRISALLTFICVHVRFHEPRVLPRPFRLPTR